MPDGFDRHARVRGARSDSTTGVNGWCAANQRTPAGIESAGTNVLDRNGSRNWIGRVKPFAPATVLATSPRAADSHATANEKAATMPKTANHSPSEAFGRKPTASATTVTTIVAT